MRYLLHDVFIQTATNHPNKTAIINEDGSHLSYFDLNKLANIFGNFISTLKIENTMAKPYVGILSNVNASSIASALGILKIGCAYVPLDEKSPEDRLSKIIDNTNLDIICLDPFWYEEYKSLIFKYHNIKWVLTAHTDLSNLPPNVLTFDNVVNRPGDELPEINQVSDDLAYILHSSGSTGIPKGIMLTHRNARTFVDWMHKEFELTSSDIIMSRAPFKFDLSVFDIFNTFKAGATLVCFDWNKTRDSEFKHRDYVDLISHSQATILYTTPSTFITLINKGNLANTKNNLRTVMYAGEPFPIPQLRKLKEAFPETKIANIYGPTETNIITYYWIDDIPEAATTIPLGQVVEDTEILIVDQDNKSICKPNEIGEIWCRGGTVTIGYLGMEEKTEACLVISPFHQFPVKFWKTGDYGYRDENGILYYKGRKDHMVKVMGFRIEIGEVETGLAGYEGFDEFAVVAVSDEKYGNRLYCYYTLLSGFNEDKDKLKNYAKSQLTEYMIPYEFINLKSMPKTSSGKIDRVLLSGIKI